MIDEPLLSLRDVSVSFSRPVGITRTRSLPGISGLDLDVESGEILSVIGASGSGKTLLAQAVLGLLPRNAALSGQIFYRGRLLDEARLKTLRGRRIAYIPQSVGNLDPLMTVGRQVRIGLDPASARAQQRTLFERYGLARDVDGRYPFQLSGGMLRRVLFATSVRDGVELVVADEPTPGLHPHAVDEILRQLTDVARAGASVVLVTHDIMAALKVSQRIAVMQHGRLVTIERASAFAGDGASLTHPFARRMWLALPQNRFGAPEEKRR